MAYPPTITDGTYFRKHFPDYPGYEPESGDLNASSA